MKADYRSLDDLPLTLTVEEAGKVLRVGRNTAYELVRCGQLRSIKVGRQLRVPKQALAEYLALSTDFTKC